MKKNISVQNYFPFVPISREFVENYMLEANPSFVVIYIYMLERFSSGEETKINDIVASTNMLETDIRRSLDYWKDKGLIKYNILDDDKSNVLEVIFLNCESSDKKELKELKKINENSEITKKSQKKLIEQEFRVPVQTMNDVANAEYYSKIDDIQATFRLAEKKLGKTLSHSERNILLNLRENYGISIEVLASLFTYCVEMGKSNLYYMEKVAINWVENEIDTPEKVEAYLTHTNQRAKETRRIMYALGIKNREPIKDEIDYIDKWISKYKMPLEIIEEACTRTIMGARGPNFKYVNTILESWFEGNAFSFEEIKLLDERHEKKNNNNSRKDKKFNKSSNNRFANYNQKPVPTDVLKKIEQRSLEGNNYNEC